MRLDIGRRVGVSPGLWVDDKLFLRRRITLRLNCIRQWSTAWIGDASDLTGHSSVTRRRVWRRLRGDDVDGDFGGMALALAVDMESRVVTDCDLERVLCPGGRDPHLDRLGYM